MNITRASFPELKTGIHMIELVGLQSSTTPVADVHIPVAFSFCQNYPNPFNPTTNISFSAGIYSHTSLRVYDLLGREIATLVDDFRPAGEFSVQFNAKKLSSGYFYRLQVRQAIRGSNSTFDETKKFALLK